MIKTFFQLLLVGLLSINSAIAADSLYKIGAGDTIRIKVYGEDTLSMDELKIDNRESIDYPYLGEIQLGGKTLEQLQKEITNGLKGDYLIDPKVNVAIVRYRNVYINGLVNSPGGYEYEPGLTVQKAISLAGGVMSKYRRSAKAYITKASDSSKYQNLSNKELADAFEKDTENEVEPYQRIHPGDTIYVVASFW
ncbi:polysaccharide biosynthesis/export family protein [Vibrio sp. TRT 21S02]|uniref:polysaccharide biosynthesis/export family protein n=1 Tax=Vibrio sp. TRT 21S02 TaxID=3418507 RepID=UPI003CE8AEEF